MGPAGFRRAVMLGGLFGGIHALLLLHWLPEAGVPLLGWPTAIPAAVAVWALNGALVAVVLGAVHRLRSPRRLRAMPVPGIPVPISLAAGWVVLGSLPASIPGVGFPWLGPEASLVEAPSLLAASPWVGGAGVAGLLAFSGAALGRVLAMPGSGSAGSGLPTRVRWLLAAFLPWGLLWAAMSFGLSGGEGRDGRGAGPLEGPGPVAARQAPLLRVAALSVEADPGLLVDAEARTRILMERLDDLTGLLAKGEVDVVVWPESPTGTFHPPLEESAAVRWSQALEVPVLFGALQGPARRNLVLAADPSGGLSPVREKRRLVPLVEGWNPGASWRSSGVFLLPVVPEGLPHGGSPGPEEIQARPGSTGVPVGALICFEALFGDEGRALRRGGARVLVLPSNEGWLAGVGVADAARRQHRSAAALRARELALPVIRSAVGGAAGVWDVHGREVGGEVRVIPGVGSVMVAAVAVGPAGVPPGSSGGAGAVTLVAGLVLLLAFAPRSAGPPVRRSAGPPAP